MTSREVAAVNSRAEKLLRKYGPVAALVSILEGAGHTVTSRLGRLTTKGLR